jgi:hypothetical protein
VTVTGTIAPFGGQSKDGLTLAEPNTGGVTSPTVTVNDDGAEMFPAASFAVQVTVVVPTANVEPEAGTHVMVGVGPTASVAVGV